MSDESRSAEMLRVNAYDLHRAEVLMRLKRRFHTRHKTLVSFASTYHFRQGQRRLATAAAASGDFDTIENWSPDRIRREPIFETHGHILSRSKGVGNWAWKPYAIAQAVANRRDGDFVIYSDAGMQAVDHDPLPPIAPLLAWLSGSERRIAAARLSGYKQSAWTKRDCFVVMDCDEARFWDVEQVQASYVAFMVSDVTRRLVREWLHYACDTRAIGEDDNEMGRPNLEGFRDHRYDQSILTNLVHKLDLEIPQQQQHSKRIKVLIGELDRAIVNETRPSENIALGKTWTASSSSDWSGRSGVYGERPAGHPPFFFHTGLDDRPWFTLDLGSVRRIAEIRIFNRWDEYGERSQNLRLWLGRTDDDYELVFDAVDAHWNPGLPLHLRFDNVAFRFLKIDLNEEQYLHLDGVEVFAAGG